MKIADCQTSSIFKLHEPLVSAHQKSEAWKSQIWGFKYRPYAFVDSFGLKFRQRCGIKRSWLFMGYIDLIFALNACFLAAATHSGLYQALIQIKSLNSSSYHLVSNLPILYFWAATALWRASDTFHSPCASILLLSLLWAFWGEMVLSSLPIYH